MDRSPVIRGPARVAAAAFVILLVAACSSGGAPALENVGSRIGGGGAQTQPLEPPSAAPAAPAAGDLPAGSGASDGSGGSAPLPSSGPLIVKTGSLDLQVLDVDSALVKARTAVAGFGGFISGSQEASKGETPTASITYRIPASSWDDALVSLRKLAAKVLGEQTAAVEVTGQVLDLEARIENLKVTEAALQAIMAKAVKISDVLDVQNQLTNVQGQIEQLSTQQAHLKDQAAYGTLTVTFETPVAPVAQAQEAWDLGAQVDQALAQLVQLGQEVATVGIWLLIVGLPFLVGLGILLGVLWLVLRRIRPRPTAGLPFGGEPPPVA